MQLLACWLMSLSFYISSATCFIMSVNKELKHLLASWWHTSFVASLTTWSMRHKAWPESRTQPLGLTVETPCSVDVGSRCWECQPVETGHKSIKLNHFLSHRFPPEVGSVAKLGPYTSKGRGGCIFIFLTEWAARVRTDERLTGCAGFNSCFSIPIRIPFYSIPARDWSKLQLAVFC